MKKLFVLFFMLQILISGQGQPVKKGFVPVNPKATPESCQLLKFLYSLQGEYTLTGQHNFVSNLKRYDSIVYALTGKYPVVWGSDFSFNAIGDDVRKFQHCGPMNLTVPYEKCEVNGRTTSELRQGLVNEIKLKHKEGRIITLMWHCCFPTSGDDCDGTEIWAWKNSPSESQWDSLVTEGTSLNNQWKKQMDGVAFYLKQLRDAKIPVLWRPYHEMNGVWFWWCNKPGETGFKKLWIMTYNYLVKHHQLNNLLWVWDTNAPRNNPGDEAGPYADYFPGIAYVDVLAADVYHEDYKQTHHDDLLKIGKGKLITLGEVGDLPTMEQYNNQRKWSWFMVWGYFINRGGAEVVKSIYNHPKSITLDKIDFTGNTYKLKKN